jgi:hypothetical protein
MLSGNKITEYSLRNKKHFPLILESLKTTSAVVLAAPLYVDCIPSHAVHFLLKAEQFCKAACHFKLYVISNTGVGVSVQAWSMAAGLVSAAV